MDCVLRYSSTASFCVLVVLVATLKCYCNTLDCEQPEDNKTCIAEGPIRCYTHILKVDGEDGKEKLSYEFGCTPKVAGTNFIVSSF